MRKIFAGVFGALIVCALAGASYGVFSPGGALSGTWNSQSVALDSGASNITGTLPFNRGGTNLAAAADDTSMVSSGSAWVASALPNCVDTGGNHLNYTTATNAYSCGTSGGGGGGTPGGATTQIQYNNAGAFGADAGLSWNSVTDVLTIGNSTGPIVGQIQGQLGTTTSSQGLGLNLVGGSGGSVAGGGGAVNIQGGVATDGNGGNVTALGATATGTNRNGGTLIAGGGTASGSGSGGNVSISAGVGGVTGSAGTVTISAGGGGTTSGAGGDATLRGGIAATLGAGGSVNVTSRDGVGTNQNGGNVVITVGQNTGSGTVGTLQFVGATATGAQTATFTATNKPGAATGAPTLWLRVVVAGTTYWVPMFAN
jgi:hypothetical protein